MVSVKSVIAAGAAAFISTAACAADMALPPPPQIPYQPVASGWYLRGDVGVGIQNFSSFDHGQTNAAFVWPASWTLVQQDIQDAAIAGFGIGYEVNNWLRLDVTGEYRTKAMFKATGSYTESCTGGGICFDANSGNYSAAVFMANAYIDLGTWWCLTPYIGAGVGGAYNMISNVQDNGIISSGTAGFGYAAGTSSSLDLAWNVQAGLTYNVTNTFKVDFSYRFLSLGSPETGVVACQNTASCPGAFYTLRDLTSQDFRIGLRWMLMPEPMPVMPLMSRG